MRVAIVTDSTAYLPDEAVARFGIDVVPLSVVMGDQVLCEGLEASPADVAHALQRRVRVTTSRPNPEAFAAAYRAAAERGAEAVVSLHLSAELSGTYEAAVLAAEDAPLPVRVVDTQMVAMALGYCVLTAAETARAGGTQ
jgi:DegV family protein with EDD domain